MTINVLFLVRTFLWTPGLRSQSSTEFIVPFDDQGAWWTEFGSWFPQLH
jgi:hypothetical protein